ncbi:hypothetical protein JW916_15695 [Candidatus Sumerlaeota bacterium]|nr:hypothetical protein [Candidatus Sumerlaeota bacterium]
MRPRSFGVLKRAVVPLSVLAVWIAGVAVWSDTIELKDGRKIEGRIVALKERSVTIEVAGSHVTLPRARLVEPDPIALFSRAKGQLAAGNAGAAVELCNQLLFWHPEDVEAKRLLEQAEYAVQNPSEGDASSSGMPSPELAADGSSPARGSRVLQFPYGWVVGTVFFRTAGAANALNLHQRDWLSGRNDPTWIAGGQAQNQVQVPPGREVLLRIKKGTTDLSFLSQLGENDLYGLQIEPDCSPKDEDLASIGRLTGLVELYISAYDSKITGRGAEELTHLTRLRTLDLSGAKEAAGNNLVFLSSLADLRELDLYGVVIRATDLDYLAAPASLEVLGLGSETSRDLLQFADHDLQRLSPLTGLKSLHLLNAQGITGRGLAYLAGADSLEDLNLAGASAFSDDNAPVLKEFPNLKNLDLSRTALTGKGLANLARTSLFELTFGPYDSRVFSDADMKAFAELTSVRKLTLSDLNMVTDAGLEPIKQMASLQLLRLVRTGFSQNGLDSLRKAMPNCNISSRSR